MSTASQYWKLTKLTASGRSQAQELAEVRSFFQKQFPDCSEPIANGPIQSSLMATAKLGAKPLETANLAFSTLEPQPSEQDSSATDLVGDLTPNPTPHLTPAFPSRTSRLMLGEELLAQMSLRCFVSKHIEMTCVQLEMQFGELHGVRRSELLPLVLDDDGRPWSSATATHYRSVARQILETFDPDRASLATWTTRLVKHNRALNDFLLECGVYLLSDWAILNDTVPTKLRRVLSSGEPLTALEIERALRVLEAYQAVYLRDRLLARKAGVKGQCPQPTEAQLEEMAQQLSSLSPISSARVLRELRTLADRLRVYRIAVRTGKMKTLSIHGHGDEDSREMDLPSPSAEESESDHLADSFVQQYRFAFAEALEQSIYQSILARYQTLKAPKNQQYLKALNLFHRQGLSMTAIATEVGLAAQFQVTRLLKLKDLREAVRREMISFLKHSVKAQATAFMTLEQLESLDHKIEAALVEQVEQLMAEDAAQAQSPKNYGKGSRFATVLCQQLDRLSASV